MLKFLIFLTVVSYINCDLPRLPVYVGSGYDILIGNPQADRVDPGFRSPIFQLRYDDHQTTPDGYFLIPDNLTVSNVEICSYSANVDIYTGPRVYQKDLKQLTDISATQGSQLLEYSFTKSSEFLRMVGVLGDSVVCESRALCEIYQLKMPVFDLLQVTTNFRNGMMMAFHGQVDFRTVIGVFGTHYVVSTAMGGRVHLQHRISRKNYDEMINNGFDIKRATELSFAKHLNDPNVDWQSEEQLLNDFKTNVKETREVYIGGRPISSDWHAWLTSVRQTPMPILYSVRSIDELLNKMNFPDLNDSELRELRENFLQAVNEYCKSLNCKDLPN